MKRKKLNKKLEISIEALSNLDKEHIKGGEVQGCYNSDTVMKVNGSCIPPTKTSLETR